MTLGGRGEGGGKEKEDATVEHLDEACGAGPARPAFPS
jgi:hypothetical protein